MVLTCLGGGGVCALRSITTFLPVVSCRPIAFFGVAGQLLVTGIRPFKRAIIRLRVDGHMDHRHGQGGAVTISASMLGKRLELAKR